MLNNTNTPDPFESMQAKWRAESAARNARNLARRTAQHAEMSTALAAAMRKAGCDAGSVEIEIDHLYQADWLDYSGPCFTASTQACADRCAEWCAAWLTMGTLSLSPMPKASSC